MSDKDRTAGTMDDRLKRAADLEAEAERLRRDIEENPPAFFRKAFLHEHKPGEFSVGCTYEPQTGSYPSYGAVAQIYAGDGWFYICTDDYEGNAMLHRESLPMLIEALQRLENHLREIDHKTAEQQQ